MPLSPPIDVILADPPWFYNQRATWSKQDPSAKTRFGGGAHDTYRLMHDKTLFYVGRYLIPRLSKDALLFMWTTGPKMPVAFECMAHWGFKFATIGFTWTKLYKKAGTPCLGPGFYSASNQEYVLIGSRGQPSKVKLGKNLVNSLLETEVILDDESWNALMTNFQENMRAIRQEHSAKPPEIRNRIAQMIGPEPVKLEMFGRTLTPGWITYGDEVTGNDIMVDLAEPYEFNDFSGSQIDGIIGFLAALQDFENCGYSAARVCVTLGR